MIRFFLVPWIVKTATVEMKEPKAHSNNHERQENG